MPRRSVVSTGAFSACVYADRQRCAETCHRDRSLYRLSPRHPRRCVRLGRRGLMNCFSFPLLRHRSRDRSLAPRSRVVPPRPGTPPRRKTVSGDPPPFSAPAPPHHGLSCTRRSDTVGPGKGGRHAKRGPWPDDARMCSVDTGALMRIPGARLPRICARCRTLSRAEPPSERLDSSVMYNCLVLTTTQRGRD
ncbi:hypothetical protein MTO96_001149 [Rhipicephalus appendiculatus]